MNYMKAYCALVRRAQRRKLKGYKEKHHIFPVSIFGKNDMVVELTAREHYLSHCLLERICISRYGIHHTRTQKMLCAHVCMKGKTNRYYNSYLYEIAKVRRSRSMMGENHWNWKGGNRNKWDPSKRKPKKRITPMFSVTKPDGNQFVTGSLNKVCREHNLSRSGMYRASHSGETWKGWFVERLNIL